jgi:DNA-binding PadR family transcriptional regulator
MYGAYMLGKYFESRNITEKLHEEVVTHMLEMLEREGFIKSSIDKDGDKELVPISEIMAKAIRDAITK